MAIIPNSIKGVITSYIRRAEELDKDPSNSNNKVMAYCCRYYAVSKGSKLASNSDPEVGKFLISQMEVLEKVKPSLNLSADKGKGVCIEYATKIFQQADEEDRSGYADKATAKLFYSAATFFDILEQFGELDESVKIY